ncbi:MAG: type II secretion system minor pseudopilin GspI [Pseudomonadota bacterium]
MTGIRFERRLRGAGGFTLVEVMVALMIVALALPSLLSIINQQIDGTAYMRDRTLAQLVASNRMEEIRLALRTGRSGQLPNTLAGTEELADRQWFWTLRTQQTQLPNFVRVELDVGVMQQAQDDAAQTPLYTLTAFLAAGLGEP